MPTNKTTDGGTTGTNLARSISMKMGILVRPINGVSTDRMN